MTDQPSGSRSVKEDYTTEQGVHAGGHLVKMDEQMHHAADDFEDDDHIIEATILAGVTLLKAMRGATRIQKTCAEVALLH